MDWRKEDVGERLEHAEWFGDVQGQGWGVTGEEEPGVSEVC